MSELGVIRKIQTIRAKRFERKYEFVSGVESVKVDDGYGGHVMVPIYTLKKVRREKNKRCVKNDKKNLSGINKNKKRIKRRG